MSRLGVLKLDTEDEDTDESKNEAGQAEWQAHFGLAVAVCALGAPHHPEVRATPGDDLTKHRADDGSDELKADLLRVEAVLATEESGDLDRKEDVRVREDESVCAGREEDRELRDHGERADDLDRDMRPRCWRDALEGEEQAPVGRLLLGGLSERCIGARRAAGRTVEAGRLGCQEDVEEELCQVDDGEEVERPLPLAGVVDNRAHDERSDRRAERREERPDAEASTCRGRSCQSNIDGGLREKMRTPSRAGSTSR